MMFARELRLPDQLQGYSQKKLEQADKEFRKLQLRTRGNDKEERPLFTTGQEVWRESGRHEIGSNPKLQPKFVGFYIHEFYPSHTY